MFSVKPQGAVDVVQLGGQLNQENAEQLVETVQSGLAEGQPMVVLDMSDVTLLDSAGLDALLDSRDAVLLKGGTVKLAAIIGGMNLDVGNRGRTDCQRGAPSTDKYTHPPPGSVTT